MTFSLLFVHCGAFFYILQFLPQNDVFTEAEVEVTIKSALFNRVPAADICLTSPVLQ